jgi:hypothetical protein
MLSSCLMHFHLHECTFLHPSSTHIYTDTQTNTHTHTHHTHIHTYTYTTHIHRYTYTIHTYRTHTHIHTQTRTNSLKHSQTIRVYDGERRVPLATFPQNAPILDFAFTDDSTIYTGSLDGTMTRYTCRGLGAETHHISLLCSKRCFVRGI